MVIHGDGRETIFNAFQGQIEVWMLISNFFEVRESFVRFRVNSRFARWLIVRHSCYPPRRATKPRCESHASKSFLKHTHGIDRMSIAATYSTEMRTNRRFARIAQSYTVRLSEIARMFCARGSSHSCHGRQQPPSDIDCVRLNSP